MHAYLRTDGMYDTFDVEPKVMSAAEYEKHVKTENLKARKFELQTEMAKIDSELKALETEESTATPVPATTTEVTTIEPSARKRW